MPELPECTIIAEQLNEVLANRIIKNSTIISGRFLISGIKGWDIFDTHLVIDKIYNKGKVIIWKLIFPVMFEEDRPSYLVFGLGITGKFTENKEKSSRIRFEMFDESKYNIFYYNDSLGYGSVKVMNEKEFKSYIKDIAKPIGLGEKTITKKEFVTKILDETSYLGYVLLNQKKVCSGIGNYQISEIFYHAKLKPETKCNELNKEKVKEIYEIIVNLIQESYKHGGVSFRDHKDIYGNKGKYQNHLKIFRKKICDGEEVKSMIAPYDSKRKIYYL